MSAVNALSNEPQSADVPARNPVRPNAATSSPELESKGTELEVDARPWVEGFDNFRIGVGDDGLVIQEGPPGRFGHACDLRRRRI